MVAPTDGNICVDREFDDPEAASRSLSIIILTVLIFLDLLSGSRVATVCIMPVDAANICPSCTYVPTPGVSFPIDPRSSPGRIVLDSAMTVMEMRGYQKLLVMKNPWSKWWGGEKGPHTLDARAASRITTLGGKYRISSIKDILKEGQHRQLISMLNSSRLDLNSPSLGEQ
jgi:hypothetical protein